MQKVYVFGLGEMYKEKREYISGHYEIQGFLDNSVDVRVINRMCEGVPVYSPDNTEVYLEPDTSIILASIHFVSMWKQLYKLGVSGERIIFGIMLPPFSEDEEVVFQEGHIMIEDENIIYYFNSGEKRIIERYEQIGEIALTLLREKYRKKYPLINHITNMFCQPASREFGLERGTAIDRYYIEKFLEENRKLIHGVCLEIAENTYTLRYGEDRIDQSHILHVEGIGENVIKGDLSTGEGIADNLYDCAIITQTLMFIFDIQKVAQNIYRMLRKNGTALITVSGISQISRYDADRWGSFYSFHEGAMRQLFEPLFGQENVEIHTYGNVKTAIALLYGLCYEDLEDADFVEHDEDYPVIISVVLRKQ